MKAHQLSKAKLIRYKYMLWLWACSVICKQDAIDIRRDKYGF